MTDILNIAKSLQDQLIAWRRDLHQHPELGFEEIRTAGRVADHLRSLGIEVMTGIGKTGVVGLISGNRLGPTVLLRFDMDALPILEDTGVPYSSQNAGVMHACGHDGHTAIGMGVAQVLVETRHQWPGQVKLLFQPAEEGLGGALAIIQDGVLQNPRPDAAFGLHLWNQFPRGQLVIQAGPLMAAADRFTITVKGRGGHGGEPHTTIDAILVGVQVANALYTIVGRNVPPAEMAVLSIGRFRGGSAFNVIAETVEMRGTLRTFKREVRDLMSKRMDEILQGISAAHGASYQLEMDDFFTPAVINDEQATKIARAAACELFGEERLVRIAPIMVAEDMAEILNRVPGCYMLVGAKPEGNTVGPHHSPHFNIEETVLVDGVALLANTAIQFLESDISSPAQATDSPPA